MELVGVNSNYINKYLLEINNNIIKINSDVLSTNIKKEKDTIIIDSNFIIKDNNEFIKYFIIFKNGILSNKSYVIHGSKINKSYIENKREYLLSLNNFNIYELNYSKIFMDNNLFYEFLHDINIKTDNLDFLLNIPICNSKIKINEFNKKLLINKTNLID